MQQHQPPPLNKRLSFTNQLLTTYENENSNPTNPQVSPYIHPPTRADNPFTQYFSNPEVSLNNPNDRRMSAAVDGTYSNPYGYNQQNRAALVQGGALFGGNGDASVAQGVAPGLSQFINPNMAPGMTPGSSGANRRSSVAVMPNHYYQQPIQAYDNKGGQYYASPARRSGSIVQYQQYQQALQHQKTTKPRKPAPKARKIRNKAELSPKIHQQPKYRRCSVNSIHISPLNALSVYLTESYSICQPRKFQYSKSTNPKRVLTKPLDPKFNNGYDNEESDYILYVNDMLGSEEGRKYMVLDLLGSGTFGQVVKCQNLINQTVCAVKVIKSKPAYMNLSLIHI